MSIEPPAELTFVGPFTSAVSAVMRLANPSERRVAFKIKTTAPKRYCVKPNSGVIEPKAAVAISVSLQPFDFDPREKNRHKFMVQSMFAPDASDANDNESLWKEADAANIMDSKLKCVFVMPESAAVNVNESSALNNDNDAGQMTAKVMPPSPKVTAESLNRLITNTMCSI